MALINCPECNKEISDKATSCPNCGFPLQPKMSEISDQEELKFPQLPADLSIGKQIVNWLGDAGFKGNIEAEINVVEGISSGTVNVTLHKQGIKISDKYFQPLLDIHNSQLISLKKTTRSELSQMDKSVIGRSVVGGLILGPLGAIVGGMSGIGTKKKVKDVSYLVINFWDINTKSAQTILVSGDKYSIEGLIARNSKLQKQSN